MVLNSQNINDFSKKLYDKKFSKNQIIKENQE